MNDVMTPGCQVFANCVVAAMVLAAVVWVVARGARTLLRLPRHVLAVFFSLAAVAMLSAQKQGGQQHGEPPPRMVPSAPTVVPAAVDDEGAWMDIVETDGQSLDDSVAFSTLGYAFRGKATLDSLTIDTAKKYGDFSAEI